MPTYNNIGLRTLGGGVLGGFGAVANGDPFGSVFLSGTTQQSLIGTLQLFEYDIREFTGIDNGLTDILDRTVWG